MGIFRTIYYLPSLIPMMVSTALWMFLYNPQFGLFNALLDAIGLPTQEWLKEPAIQYRHAVDEPIIFYNLVMGIIGGL